MLLFKRLEQAALNTKEVFEMIHKVLRNSTKKAISLLAAASVVSGQFAMAMPANAAYTGEVTPIFDTAVQNIKADPCLSMEKKVVPASAAGTKVTIDVYMNDENMGDNTYYYYPYVYVDFDGRLTYNGVKSGTKDGSIGMSIKNSMAVNTVNRRTLSIYSNSGSGKNGTYATIEVTVPAYAQPGDIFYFNICNTNTLKTRTYASGSGNVTGALIENIKTADVSGDAYLKDTAFDGYILIDPNSAPNSSAVEKPYDRVVKDHVAYNVYKDHAEVAYCEYEAAEAAILSEIDGKKVTAIADCAFMETNATSVSIPDTVTTIGNNAFVRSAVEELTIPDSVTSVGISAFNSSGLKSITLSENLTALPETVFGGCQKLTEVTVPESVETIGTNAFYNCSALKELKLPSGLKAIPSGMCYGCIALEAITIPSDVTVIGSYAFQNTGLKSVVVPDGVKVLEPYTFAGSKKLTEVKLPSELVKISCNNFYHCEALEELELPEKLEAVERWAFEATKIKELKLPASLKSVEMNSFGSSNIESIVYPDELETLPENAYSGAGKMTSVKLPSKLTAIPNYAFYNCAALTELELPEGVKSIGQYAFQYCGIKEFSIPDSIETLDKCVFAYSNFESMEIPERFTELPGFMFMSSPKLKTVKLPSELKAIPESMFSGCSAFNSVEIPESVTSIGAYAFQSCALSEIKLPSNIETIGSNAFSSSALTSIEFPDSITELSDNIFANAYKLKTVKLPSKLTNISSGSFLNCTSIESIDIPETVKSIGTSAFQGCSALKSLTLPDAVESIDYRAFLQCGVTELKMPTSLKTLNSYTFEGSNIESIIYDDELTTLPDNAFGTAQNLKSVKLPSKLTAIPNYAFHQCNKLESVEIPETVTKIGNGAFYGCSSLTEISLPDGVETMGERVFEATPIKEVKLPAALKSCTNTFYNSNIEKAEFSDETTIIPNNAFYNARYLNTVKLPEKLENIGNYAFAYCAALKSFELTDTVTSIGESAFMYSGITSLKLPASLKEFKNAFAASNIETIECSDGIKELPFSAFSNIGKLKSIKLPADIETIPDYAFANCAALTSLDIPKNVTAIGQYAFNSCGVKEIDLPASVKSIGRGAFMNASAETVEIPEGVETISYSAFENAKSPKSVKLNEGLKNIQASAFNGCSSLSELNIPDTVTNIDYSAFCGTALKSVVIPDSVTSINTSSMFKNCTALESVTLPQSITALYSYAFNNCGKLTGVDIPDSVTSIDNDVFNGTVFTSLYIPAGVTRIDKNAFRNSKINTIIGYKGSYAEAFAKENGFEFVESEGRVWTKTDSLPTSGSYKLDCDVTVEKDVTINGMLDLDLNGHTVIVRSIKDNGNLIIRDTSDGMKGVVKKSETTGELIGINGKLTLLGGTFKGTEMGDDSATLGLNGGAESLVIDGAKVYAYSSNAISVRGGSASIDVKSGSLESTYNMDGASYSVHSAVYIRGSYNGSINVTGGEIKAGTGAAVYSVSNSAVFNISGGKITSEGSCGLYFNKDNTVNLSGDICINGKSGGIYVPEDGKVNITGDITSADVSVFAEKSGVLTEGLGKFAEASTVEKYLSSINANGELSLNDDGEICIEIPVVTTTTTTTATTTSTTTTATSPIEPKPETSDTTTTVTETTSTTTAPVTTETTTTTHVLDVHGELHVTPMTKDEVVELGIDLNDDDNFNCVKYSIEADFDTSGVVMNSVVKYDEGYEPVNYTYLEFENGNRVVIADSAPVWVPQIHAHVIHQETVDEEMYLFIYGESKWLKEFYNVQLVIMNRGNGTLTSSSSVLDIPEGLTLMDDNATHDMGDIAPGEVKTSDWCVRGDEEGDYSLTAHFSCYDGDTLVERDFHSEENLHVYSTSALKMYIELPKYSFYKKDYPIKITLKNVSDKTLYDLENRIRGVKQASKATLYFNDLDEHGNIIMAGQITKQGTIYKKNNVACVSVEELAPHQSVTLEFEVPDLWKSVYEQYIDAETFDAVTNTVLHALTANPNLINVDFIRDIYAAALNEMPTAHILKMVDVSFIGSNSIPYEVKIVDNSDGRSFPIRRIQTNTANNLLSDIFFGPDRPVNALDQFRNEYIYSMDTTNAGEVLSGFVQYLNRRPMPWMIRHDAYVVVHTHNDLPANVRIVADVRKNAPSEDGENNTENVFTLTDINGTEPDENGAITINGETIIKISADKAGASGTLVVDYSDGTTEEHKLRSIEEHECSSTGAYELVSAPQNGEYGLAVRRCDTCGEVTDSFRINPQAVAMLSNKNTYADIRVAVEEAVEAGEKTELSLFGNIDVTADIEIPDYIDVLIAPDTVIKPAEGCKLTAKGEVNDFSGYSYDLSGNGPLVPKTTTTTTVSDETTTTTTTTAETTTTITSETTTTTTTTEISSDDKTFPDEKLAEWAQKDFEKKTSEKVSETSVTTTSDGNREIVLKDAEGNVLETYVIDPETGLGKNSANEAVALPKTGNNSLTDLFAVCGAIIMVGLGFASVVLSGIFGRRRKNDK